MRADDAAATEAGSWYVEADPGRTTASGKRLSKKPSQAKLYEARLTSTRVAIASSLFLVFLAASLLVGGHAAIGPLLQSAVAARESSGRGDVVYTMPDGIFCRHISFDNMTAEITEGALQRCQSDIGRGRTKSTATFSWGAR